VLFSGKHLTWLGFNKTHPAIITPVFVSAARNSKDHFIPENGMKLNRRLDALTKTYGLWSEGF
jgi:hypothetical protein